MADSVETKKEAKKNSLLAAAQSLFLEKGMSKTSISEITDRAKVAKGTFYLYFTDKEDLHRQLIYQISYDVIRQAFDYTEYNPSDTFADKVVCFADWIINYFTEHTEILRLIRRGFSWPMISDQLVSSGFEERSEDPLWQAIFLHIQEAAPVKSLTPQELFNTFYLIVEMCGIVCYSSIIEKKPDTIENVKPLLYSMIRKVLS